MSSDHAAWTLRREIPSDTTIGSELVDELLAAMTEREWPSADLFRTQLAYQEAIVNAIRHGNHSDPDKTVTVEMSCDDQRATITITDQGDGFDPNDVPDPRSDELLEVPGGRGVLLINEIMNEVAYNDRGNQIKMTKIKGANPPADEDDDE
ncbi:ATP-binding protein [Roseiconus lacunae]|uniref:ATP-binding protein n=1 Tax=Roseiconus lacunae TaxID=2605694 RepID=A0ABT7PQ34_9BACT|nr:ATP-binding protein [Roseiconus lacunae]MDM4018560.1 ATP-binding protein [Roseiconus lacunae]